MLKTLKTLKMLREFGQPIQHMSQHHATMLHDVALKCCERLARPKGVCVNIRCYVTMLPEMRDKRENVKRTQQNVSAGV